MNPVRSFTFSRLKAAAPAGWILLAAAASVGGYLIASLRLYRLGFPLDDAWIHQTYARNLARLGEWSFIPGQASAGSTSPLWTALNAPGFWLGLSPLVWSYLLGWLALAAVGWTGADILRRLGISGQRACLLGGIFLTLEWHLVWAAGSGMETLLFSLAVLLVWRGLLAPVRNWLGLGLISGLSVWLRPDGITLAGPILLAALLMEADWRGRLEAGFRFGFGLLVWLIPYAIFNLALAGAIWPNTFFAKQIEYAVRLQIPLLVRYLAEWGLPLVGAGAVLLPGFLMFFHHSLKNRRWVPAAFGVWLAGFLLLYALRLPVTYQHGRYVIPAMPVYFLLGLAGLIQWVSREETARWRWIIGRAWMVSAGLVLGAFWWLGGRAYARDVAVIESEMVTAAQWIAQNTPPEALIAAHDIGAVGYFSDRQLIDLAGLVSPEVIPFIRDEQQLARLLDEKGADYLMTFPGWYPQLTRRGELVFSTQGAFSPQQGGENMQVYRWR